MVGAVSQSANGLLFASFDAAPDKVRGNLVDDKLFPRDRNGDAIEVPKESLNTLRELARSGNPDAAEVLMQYTCYSLPETRDFAKNTVADLYREVPSLIGKLAGEFVTIFASVPTTAQKDYPGMPLVALTAAKYEKSSNKTGEPYMTAMQIVRQYYDRNHAFIVGGKEGTIGGDLGFRDFTADNRLIPLEELRARAAVLDGRSVEHCGVYRLDGGDLVVPALADLVERAKSQQDSGAVKTLLAVLYDQDRDHYVSVLIRGDEVAILDSLPPHNADETGTGKKVEAALRTAERDEKPIFSAVTTVSRDLQSRRFDDDPGVPNGCGLINLELHWRLSALEGDLGSPLDLVNRFADGTAPASGRKLYPAIPFSTAHS